MLLREKGFECQDAGSRSQHVSATCSQNHKHTICYTWRPSVLFQEPLPHIPDRFVFLSDSDHVSSLLFNPACSLSRQPSSRSGFRYLEVQPWWWSHKKRVSIDSWLMSVVKTSPGVVLLQIREHLQDLFFPWNLFIFLFNNIFFFFFLGAKLWIYKLFFLGIFSLIVTFMFVFFYTVQNPSVYDLAFVFIIAIFDHFPTAIKTQICS